MSEIAMMLQDGDEKGLAEHFGRSEWRSSVTDIGGKELVKEFDEINKDKKKEKSQGNVRKNIAEISEDEWLNYLKQIEEEK